MLGKEEGFGVQGCSEWDVLEHVSEFKYLGCVWDESGTGELVSPRKVASGRMVAGGIRSLVNT